MSSFVCHELGYEPLPTCSAEEELERDAKASGAGVPCWLPRRWLAIDEGKRFPPSNTWDAVAKAIAFIVIAVQVHEITPTVLGQILPRVISSMERYGQPTIHGHFGIT